MRIDGTPLRVMVVEDEILLRRVLEDEFMDEGAVVLEGAASGMDAIAQAHILEPDLVVMDISLRGEMDGIDAARQIQQRSDTSVLFLSANDDATTRARVAALGGAELLRKPTPIQRVVEAARRACNRV